MIPVNPYADEILGEPAYASLKEIQERVEVVNVFRPAADAPAVAREAVHAGAKALWLQQGIASEAARALAEEAGLLYVEDVCIGVARARYGVRK